MEFKNLQLKEFIKKTLKAINFTKLTPIQAQVIPPALKNENIIACSNPGSGKTHAFLIPIMEKINENNNQVQAIIISPTRELAQQIYQMAKIFTNFNDQLKIAVITGGEDLQKQIKKLKSVPHIVVATVNRLKDLYDQQLIKITLATMIVIDECDMIFELGFLESVDFLLNKINNLKQIMTFSATINQELEIFLKKYLTKPKIFNLTNYQAKNINHILFYTKNQDRNLKLLDLLATFKPYLCFIFVNKKNEVNDITNLLKNENYQVCQLHGDLSSRDRKNILTKIRNLEYQYIVTTDIMARGIDIPGVSHIISLNLPNNIEYYIHRSGRTGRNNSDGTSYVLYDDDDLAKINQLKKFNINFSKDNKKSEKIKINDPEILKITAKYKKVIKPGYKKKINNAIQILKRKKMKKKKIWKNVKGEKNE